VVRLSVGLLGHSRGQSVHRHGAVTAAPLSPVAGTESAAPNPRSSRRKRSCLAATIASTELTGQRCCRTIAGATTQMSRSGIVVPPP